MHVAVDARPLLHPYTGIGRYTKKLVDGLQSRGHSVSMCHAPKSKPLEVIVANTVFAVRHRRADLFWSPRHHLPLLPCKRPTVVTIHDLVWLHAPETMSEGRAFYDRTLTKRSVSLANQIICVSDSTARDLVSVFPQARDKITTIGLAPTVHPDEFPGVKAESSERPYLLFVGTNEPRKNLSRVIDAFLQSRAAHSYDLKVVANKGWKTQVDFDKNSRVQHISEASDQKIAELYFGCHFVIAPSIFEGYGLQLAEAAAFAKPVVTSKTSSMPEVCNGAGILVDPMSTEAIQKAIDQLIVDPTCHRKLTEQARRNDQGRNWTDVVDQTIAVFTNALAS